MRFDFDRTRCSFPVPNMETDVERDAWFRTLTFTQKMELMWWSHVKRYGEEHMRRGMDKTYMRSMTMEEFNAMKAAEDAEEAARQA